MMINGEKSFVVTLIHTGLFQLTCIYMEKAKRISPGAALLQPIMAPNKRTIVHV